MKCIISCEHASNKVPEPYAHLFQGHRNVLTSHQAYDWGAAKFARRLAAELKVPVYLGLITRLLVDLNRSLSNKRNLFTQYSRKLGLAERELLLKKYYQPYRTKVEKALGEIIDGGKSVLHISVHSFTPVKNGMTRRADIGLLYDPARQAEKEICTFIINQLKREVASVQVRRNFPYLGKTDGFNSFMRRKFSAQTYAGIEIEMNQAFLFKNDIRKRKTINVMAEGIKDILMANEY